MNCKWIINKNITTKNPKRYICEQCGFTINNNAIHKECGRPRLTKRAVNLAKATVKHIQTGMKHCDETERERRFNVCKSCPRYIHDICAHDDCGCIIRSKGKFLDKLSWADSKCPENKW